MKNENLYVVVQGCKLDGCSGSNSSEGVAVNFAQLCQLILVLMKTAGILSCPYCLSMVAARVVVVFGGNAIYVLPDFCFSLLGSFG